MRSGTKKICIGLVAIGLVVTGWASLDEPEDKKLLVGRIWVDQLPKSNTDFFEVFVALDEHSVGIFQRQSSFEGSYSIFGFEVSDDRIRMLFPQNKSKHDVKYKAEACSEKDFDYCLSLQGAPRGAKQYKSKKGWEVEADDAAELIEQLEAWRATLPADQK